MRRFKGNLYAPLCNQFPTIACLHLCIFHTPHVSQCARLYHSGLSLSLLLLSLVKIFLKSNLNFWQQAWHGLFSRDLKGQLHSEWIYEVIVSPKMQTKNYKDFCPTKQTSTVAKKNCLHSPKKKCYNPCMYGKAEVIVIFGLHFGRNDDLLNSEWIYEVIISHKIQK